MTKIIEVIVRPDGSSQLETRGFAGSECQQASAFIEDALGTRSHAWLTSEFYEQQYDQHRVQEGT